MKFIGLIPARGGSKGIPKKNIIDCAGKPLIWYTAQAALGCKALSQTILSTDEEEIANLGRSFGLEVPFLRPSNLSGDNAESMGVILHTFEYLETVGIESDALVFLQPTSPLRNSKHIEEAIKLFIKSNADSLVSVVSVPHRYHPDELLSVSNKIVAPVITIGENPKRRQLRPNFFARNGPAILILSRKQILTGKFYTGKTIAYPMSQLASVDVDDLDDLSVAEAIIKWHSSKGYK